MQCLRRKAEICINLRKWFCAKKIIHCRSCHVFFTELFFADVFCEEMKWISIFPVPSSTFFDTGTPHNKMTEAMSTKTLCQDFCNKPKSSWLPGRRPLSRRLPTSRGDVGLVWTEFLTLPYPSSCKQSLPSGTGHPQMPTYLSKSQLKIDKHRSRPSSDEQCLPVVDRNFQ